MFETSGPGFHIIFGPNEAGKSSSLRALKALLYGFPERTSDNFQHANNQLLVGGCIEGAEGREINFDRRKKRKADLLDHEGNPLDPGALAAFLNGVEPELFYFLYGIDHKTLIAGGEDILAQEGEVGQALFSAGTGITSLKKILDGLEAEADELFKSRGSKQQINQALKQYKDLKKRRNELTLLPRKWKEHQKRLQTAKSEHVRLDKERRLKSAELKRIERLQKAIPELSELANLEKQLEELGEVVMLPPNFSEQLREIEQAIRETKLQIDSEKDQLNKFRKKQNDITLNEVLLNHEKTIENLHQRLGEYQKGQTDRNKLDGMHITHRREAGALIEMIRSDWNLEKAESLRPVLGKKRTIQELTSQHSGLKQNELQAQSQIDTSEKELENINKILSAQPPIKENEELFKAIKMAQNMGDIDEQIVKISRDIENGKKTCLAELKRLGLWFGTLDQLLNLTLPLPETLRRFDLNYSDTQKEIQQLNKERKRIEAELKAAKSLSKELTYSGEIPSENDLEESRKKRQFGWLILRRKWIDGEDISKEVEKNFPGQQIHDVYEKRVEEADIIADRLRREADRVAKAASLRAKTEELEDALQEISRQEKLISVREENLTAEWETVWEETKIKPLTPKEMINWLTDIDSLRYKLNDLSNKETEANDKKEIRKKCLDSLIMELTSLDEKKEFPGKELTPVKLFAESILDKIINNKTKHEKLSENKDQELEVLKKAQEDKENTGKAMREWKHKWDNTLDGIGLKDQITPGEMQDFLETIEACISKLDKAKELQSRINGIDRDAKKFCSDVISLIEQAATNLKTIPPEQAVLKLNTMLGQVRQDNELFKKNHEEIETLIAKIDITEKKLDSMNEQMKKLLTTAKEDDPENLTKKIWRYEEHQRLNEKISNTQSSLAKVREGIPLEEIKLQAADVNVDELPGLISALSNQIEQELHPKIEESLQLIGEEKKELQLMDGSAQAADIAEKMEQVASKIKRLTDQYTKIKLATIILKNEIERYREENQDPLLKIASKIFSDLTLGSFAGLRTDIADNGNSILVGIRSDDSRVPVEGMSDGTCDQLYLALRLATLQSRLEKSEPMPFIVDDILINFDDERSNATIKVLAELSKKNQVILFTHHRKIVEEARNFEDSGIVQVHEL